MTGRRELSLRVSLSMSVAGLVMAVVAATTAAIGNAEAASVVGWSSLALLALGGIGWAAVRWADTRRATAATAQVLSRIAEVRTRVEPTPLIRQVHQTSERQVEMLAVVLARLEAQRATLELLGQQSDIRSLGDSPGALAQRVERSVEVAGELALRVGRPVPSAPAPTTQDPGLELTLADLVVAQGGPSVIGVIGDGAAAIVAALAVSRSGREGRVLLADHRPSDIVQTEQAAADLGLTSVVAVEHVPLVRHVLGGRTAVWYDDQQFGIEWEDVQLLVVAGPGADAFARASNSRPPFLERLVERSVHVLFDALADEVAVEVPGRPPERSRRIDATELAPTVWNERYGRPASYTHKLHESKRRSSILQLLDHRQPVWAHNDKLSGYRLAERAGVRTPQVFYRSTTLDDVDWTGLPPRFVVKPLDGANNRGVFLLVAAEDGWYLDLMDNRHKTLDEVCAEYAALADAKKITSNFAVEELVRPGDDLADVIDIPDDLKVYCFYDRSVVAMQRRMNGTSDRSKWTFKFWDRDGIDLGPVKYPDRCDPDLQRPEGLDEVFVAAESIGQLLAWPFCRLDFYASSEGPVFGEIAPHPGPPEVWNETMDERLGREWELAEARLLVDGIPLVERRPR